MIIKKLDEVRKKVMPKVTQRIGKNHFKKILKNPKKLEIEKILICRPNQRLGNMLLTTPLIQEVVTLFPDCKIDIIVKGTIANELFSEYTNIEKIITLPRKPFKELFNYLKIFFSVKTKKYDLVINAASASSSGKILTYLANSKYKVYTTVEEQKDQIKQKKDFTHIAKKAVYNLRFYLRAVGYDIPQQLVPGLCLALNDDELRNGKQVLEGHIPDTSKKTIGIFTFATGPKCYTKEWWAPFYKELKTRFESDYNIIEILPIENVSQINFEAPTYYSKDVREIGSVLANTEIFIGADSGMMHLASASKVPTVGLFCVTKTEVYEPYDNNSTSINTNHGTITEYINEIEVILKKNIIPA